MFVSAPDSELSVAAFDFTRVREGVQGYAWTFPVQRNNQRAYNIGVFDSRVHQRHRDVSLPRILSQHLERVSSASPTVAEEPRVSSHPLRRWSWRSSPSAPNLLLVGDAYGADGFTGEGIAFALEHGLSAGTALAETGMDPLAAPPRYAELLRHAQFRTALRGRAAVGKIVYAPLGSELLDPALWLTERVIGRRRDPERQPRFKN